MSDSEAARESLPSISDLSLNPPSAKPTSTESKPKKDVEKGICLSVLLEHFRSPCLDGNIQGKKNNFILQWKFYSSPPEVHQL